MKLVVSILASLALLSISTMASRADEFSRIANCPETYWVPAQTPPPPGYYGSAPQPYYYGPPPPGYYYGPPSPRPPVVIVPRFYFGFHFH